MIAYTEKKKEITDYRDERLEFRICKGCKNIGLPKVVFINNRYRVECEKCSMFLMWATKRDAKDLVKRRAALKAATIRAVRCQNSLPKSWSDRDVSEWLKRGKPRWTH